MNLWDYIFPVDKKIIIWGAGENGKKWCAFLLSLNREIECFFDKNAKHIDQTGMVCVEPRQNNTLSSSCIVLISPRQGVDTIYKNAKEYGFKEIVIGNIIDFLPKVADFPLEHDFPPFGHFYSLYPDLAVVNQYYKMVADKAINDGIDLNVNVQLTLLSQMNEMFNDKPAWNDYNDFVESSYRYRTHNPTFSINDALVLHFMLRIFKPKNMIEVGSGYSSAVTLDTCEQFIEMVDLKFIEPYPQLFFSLLKENDRDSVTLIDKNLQDISLKLFEKLEAGDILFIDSTHVSKFASDVNYLFFNILPRLKTGVIVHLHDIFYPWEYPEQWIGKGMGWNELYLLRAFLQYNQEWKILFYSSFMEKKHFEEYQDEWKKIDGFYSGSFWMQKK